MTDEQILAFVAGDLCFCGDRTSAGRAFCWRCFSALSMPQRLNLANARDDHWRAGAIRSCAVHVLGILPERKPSRDGSFSHWPFTSDDELYAGGWRQSGGGRNSAVQDRCNVPGCHQRIWWWRSPNGKALPLNFPDCQPHRTTCKDPNYFAMKREEKRVQASARRRKRVRRG